MRVLMLVEGGEVLGNPSPDSYSGYLRYFGGAVVVLQSYGVEVVFGSLRDRTPLHEHLEALGCSTFSLGARSVYTYPRSVWRLSRLIKAWNPDVLHLHESISAAVGGLAGALVRHKGRIFHRHHTMFVSRSGTFSFLAARTSDLVMAVSESAAEHARRYDRVPERRITVVHNGVDPPASNAATNRIRKRAELEVADDAVVVTILGHLRPEKGHRTLFSAMEKVTKHASLPVVVQVVGSGPEEAQLRELSLSRPWRTIFVEHQKSIWPCLAASDLLIVPSLSESFGLVAVEGMAAGVPLLASDTGGLREVIEDGVSGVLFRPGDKDDLAEKLLHLLNDAPKRKSLAEAGRLRYQGNFTMELMAEGWLDCYRRVMRRGLR